MTPKPSAFMLLLVQLRSLVGGLQVLLIVGGCAGLFLEPTGLLLSASIQWFIIATVAQVVIIVLIALLAPKG